MKIACGVLIALFSGGAVIAAQSAMNQASFGVVGGPAQVNSPPPQKGCPVSMHASHLADGSMVKTSTAHPKGIGQWLRLSLASGDARQITRATLIVDGLTPKARMTQTLSKGNGTSTATQSFSVALSAGPDRTATTSIWVPGMSAVQRIELVSVDYGDGSTWKGANCQVTPDPMMLITSR